MRWTINALLKRTDRRTRRGEQREEQRKERDGEGDGQMEEQARRQRGAAIEKLRQLSNSIKVPARMLTAPKLKEAANADEDEDEDEDVAQSDRLQDEPAETETETELLSSFTPLPSLLSFAACTLCLSGKRKAATPSSTAARWQLLHSLVSHNVN